MTVFGLPVSCPQCGGTMELVNASVQGPHEGLGTSGVAVLGCECCGRQWTVSMQLRPHAVPYEERKKELRRQGVAA